VNLPASGLPRGAPSKDAPKSAMRKPKIPFKMQAQLDTVVDPLGPQGLHNPLATPVQSRPMTAPIGARVAGARLKPRPYVDRVETTNPGRVPPMRKRLWIDPDVVSSPGRGRARLTRRERLMLAKQMEEEADRRMLQHQRERLVGMGRGRGRGRRRKQPNAGPLMPVGRTIVQAPVQPILRIATHEPDVPVEMSQAEALQNTESYLATKAEESALKARLDALNQKSEEERLREEEEDMVLQRARIIEQRRLRQQSMLERQAVQIEAEQANKSNVLNALWGHIAQEGKRRQMQKEKVEKQRQLKREEERLMFLRGEHFPDLVDYNQREEEIRLEARRKAELEAKLRAAAEDEAMNEYRRDRFRIQPGDMGATAKAIRNEDGMGTPDSGSGAASTIESEASQDLDGLIDAKAIADEERGKVRKEADEERKRIAEAKKKWANKLEDERQHQRMVEIERKNEEKRIRRQFIEERERRQRLTDKKDLARAQARDLGKLRKEGVINDFQYYALLKDPHECGEDKGFDAEKDIENYRDIYNNEEEWSGRSKEVSEKLNQKNLGPDQARILYSELRSSRLQDILEQAERYEEALEAGMDKEQAMQAAYECHQEAGLAFAREQKLMKAAEAIKRDLPKPNLPPQNFIPAVPKPQTPPQPSGTPDTSDEIELKKESYTPPKKKNQLPKSKKAVAFVRALKAKMKQGPMSCQSPTALPGIPESKPQLSPIERGVIKMNTMGMVPPQREIVYKPVKKEEEEKQKPEWKPDLDLDSDTDSSEAGPMAPRKESDCESVDWKEDTTKTVPSASSKTTSEQGDPEELPDLPNGEENVDWADVDGSDIEFEEGEGDTPNLEVPPKLEKVDKPEPSGEDASKPEMTVGTQPDSTPSTVLPSPNPTSEPKPPDPAETPPTEECDEKSSPEGQPAPPSEHHPDEPKAAEKSEPEKHPEPEKSAVEKALELLEQDTSDEEEDESPQKYPYVRETYTPPAKKTAFVVTLGVPEPAPEQKSQVPSVVMDPTAEVWKPPSKRVPSSPKKVVPSGTPSASISPANKQDDNTKSPVKSAEQPTTSEPLKPKEASPEPTAVEQTLEAGEIAPTTEEALPEPSQPQVEPAADQSPDQPPPPAQPHPDQTEQPPAPSEPHPSEATVNTASPALEPQPPSVATTIASPQESIKVDLAEMGAAEMGQRVVSRRQRRANARRTDLAPIPQFSTAKGMPLPALPADNSPAVHNTYYGKKIGMPITGEVTVAPLAELPTEQTMPEPGTWRKMSKFTASFSEKTLNRPKLPPTPGFDAPVPIPEDIRKKEMNSRAFLVDTMRTAVNPLDVLPVKPISRSMAMAVSSPDQQPSTLPSTKSTNARAPPPLEEPEVKEEPQDPVKALLETADALKYYDKFVDEECDTLEVLFELQDADLRNMGVKTGPRKRILKAIREKDPRNKKGYKEKESRHDYSDEDYDEEDGEEVREFLETNGFGKYIPKFIEERCYSLDVLFEFEDRDLRNMGIKTGPRKALMRLIRQEQKDRYRAYTEVAQKIGPDDDGTLFSEQTMQTDVFRMKFMQRAVANAMEHNGRGDNLSVGTGQSMEATDFHKLEEAILYFLTERKGCPQGTDPESGRIEPLFKYVRRALAEKKIDKEEELQLHVLRELRNKGTHEFYEEYQNGQLGHFRPKALAALRKIECEGLFL